MLLQNRQYIAPKTRPVEGMWCGIHQLQNDYKKHFFSCANDWIVRVDAVHPYDQAY